LKGGQVGRARNKKNRQKLKSKEWGRTTDFIPHRLEQVAKVGEKEGKKSSGDCGKKNWADELQLSRGFTRQEGDRNSKKGPGYK